MGGFGGFNFPMQPTTGAGDLTNLLQGVTNALPGTGFNWLGTGSTNTGAGVGQLGQAFGTTAAPQNYWQQILSGNPGALTAAAAPTANALSNVYSGALNNASTNLPAGGYRSVTMAQLPQAQAAQVGNSLLSLQPTAAQNLQSLAGTQAGIGSATGSLGLGQAGIGGQTISTLLQALLGQRGQNIQSNQNTWSDILGTIGLGFGGGATGAKLAGLSDLLAKEALIPLGVHKGIPVYAFRYIGDPEVYMGVVAQEVQQIAPECVIRGSDGLLRVFYDKLFKRMELVNG